MRARSTSSALILVVVLVAALLRVAAANPAMAQTQSIGAWRVGTEPTMDGFAPEWQSILPVFLPTTAQQVTPPMGGGTVERIAVRAVHWKDQLYVMLEWSDQTQDLASSRYETFTDAAAVQFPAEAGSEVPFICMGQADQAVNIWQWRSDQQLALPALAEDGYVDLYPFTDDLYYTARQAGNPLSQVDRLPVQNLVAGGFGTLAVTDVGTLQGHGGYENGRWTVVFTRPFQPAGDLQPVFGGGAPIDVAFAVWDGSRGERDGLKSVSAFIQLTITPEDPPRRAMPATEDWPAYNPPNPLLGIGVGFVVLLAAASAVGWVFLSRGKKVADENEQ
jgi:complex iron-sulfur molybdoenzyme family reductase subunit gamma